ncbi:hypothetical protein [Gulosibacter faecalis]|uniref:Uncharacterized protein n=1 Tax=Gulosibacter faecalis TaxID=272240 RepID=A0ABW5UXB0_9MICO|nr:hypothetical protein [Gulosibacter faecalis]
MFSIPSRLLELFRRATEEVKSVEAIDGLDTPIFYELLRGRR